MAVARGGIQVDGAREAGLDPDGLRRALGLVAEWVDGGILPGAGAVVARGGRIAGEAYLGTRRRGDDAPVDDQTIWSLASITKPVTATAVMLLVEEGRLGLDEPLVDLVPEFADGPATGIDRRLVTLRHCLGHCSGLPGVSEDNLALRRAHRPIEAFARSFMRQPLFFAPGTMHVYSNPAITMAAEAVGRALGGALGRPVEEPMLGRIYPFVRERILAPLGLTSTDFRPPAAWDERIALVSGTGQEGNDWEMANSAYYRGLGMPWGGLFGTPREIARFADLFLPSAAGAWRLDAPAGRRRIVSPATALAMCTVQWSVPDAPPELCPAELREGVPWPLRPAVSWGIGWALKGVGRGHASGDLTSPATFSHGGASGTVVWADPATDLVCALFTNQALRSGWSEERPRQGMFGSAVAAALG
jgi:CubicO group peptidase (beta-lactamase class C family)